MENATEVIHGYRGPYCTLRWKAGGDVGIRSILRRSQALCASGYMRMGFARAIVRGKIASLQKYIQLTRWNNAALAQTLRNALESANAAANVDDLRGIEGSASRRFYEELQKRLPESLGFSGRNRRPPKDPVNAAISYGNSIIYGLCVPPIAESGMNPAIGFLHEPGVGRHSLALDFSEPIKPFLVDCAIWTLVEDGTFTPALTTEQQGACYLNGEGRKALRKMMNVMAQKIPGESGDRQGWPLGFLGAMTNLANRIVKDVLAGASTIDWTLE